MRRRFYIAIVCFTAFPMVDCRSSVDKLRIQAAFRDSKWARFCRPASQTSTGGFVTDCWRADASEQRTQVDAIFTAAQVALLALILSRLRQCPRNSRTRGALLPCAAGAARVWRYLRKIERHRDLTRMWTTHLLVGRVGTFRRTIPSAALETVRASRNEKWSVHHVDRASVRLGRHR